MATNRYFNFLNNDNEQTLLNGFIEEAIQIYGMDTIYVPRTLQAEDKIFGEDVLSKFVDVYEMEMYFENFDRFGGQGDFMQKFGLQVDDVLTVIVSTTTFTKCVEGKFARPREGDLIFFPLNKQLFEITFVEDEPSFYQLGKRYMYKISAKLFTYTNQEIQTGIADIDTYATAWSYAVELVLTTGTGNFLVGETVFQGTNFASATATGKVIAIDDEKLTINFVSGTFVSTAGAVKGQTSLASWTMASIDYSVNTNIDTDNKDFEELTEDLVVKNPNNPFGNF